MKKSIILLLLSLSMTTSAFAFSDTQDSRWNQEIQALTDLQIISGYGDNTFLPNNTLSRGEAAVFAVNALGSYGTNMLTAVKDSQNPFPDIPTDYFAANQIYLLNLLNIVNGYEDGQFHPENMVTYGELAKICIELIGYGSLVPQTENWVSGYIQAGQKYGFFDGLTITDETANIPATREDTAKIIYNTIHIPLCQETAYNNANGEITHTIMDGTNGTTRMTCLTEYFSESDQSSAIQ